MAQLRTEGVLRLSVSSRLASAKELWNFLMHHSSQWSANSCKASPIEPPEVDENCGVFDVKSHVTRSMQCVQSSSLFKNSVFWTSMLEVEKNRVLDPRFCPQLLKATADKLNTTAVINLYAHGFSFDNRGQAFAYARNLISVIDAINLGILPGQVDQLLLRTPTAAHQPRQMNFYEGGIILEIRDHRDGRAIWSETTHSLQPFTFRLYCKSDFHGLIHYLDLQKATFQIRCLVESHLSKEIHPDILLDPDPFIHTLLNAIAYKSQMWNVPFKNVISRKKTKIFHRTQTPLPSPVPAPRQSMSDSLFYKLAFNDETHYSIVPPDLSPAQNDQSPLFQHLKLLGYQPQYLKQNDVVFHTLNEKKHHSNVPANPTGREHISHHPEVNTSLVFTVPKNVQPYASRETLTFKITHNNSTPKQYVGHFKMGYTYVEFPLGTLQLAQKFVNQLTKLEIFEKNVNSSAALTSGAMKPKLPLNNNPSPPNSIPTGDTANGRPSLAFNTITPTTVQQQKKIQASLPIESLNPQSPTNPIVGTQRLKRPAKMMDPVGFVNMSNQQSSPMYSQHFSVVSPQNPKTPVSVVPKYRPMPQQMPYDHLDSLSPAVTPKGPLQIKTPSDNKSTPQNTTIHGVPQMVVPTSSIPPPTMSSPVTLRTLRTKKK